MSLCLVAGVDAGVHQRTARVVEAGSHRTVRVGFGDLLVAVARERPDVVVVAADPASAGGSGPAWVAAVAELHGAAPQLAVLVTGPPGIGRDDELRLAATALHSGACGYLRSAREAGSPPFGADGPPSATGLSLREHQVLQGMTAGLSNSEIAAALGLADDTVKSHARRLFRRLGAEDRAHAVAHGFRRGILR
jgi:DNA-binding CsgD family transcriptional regulator